MFDPNLCCAPLVEAVGQRLVVLDLDLDLNPNLPGRFVVCLEENCLFGTHWCRLELWL